MQHTRSPGRPAAARIPFSKKLMFGAASAATVAIVGTAGIAAAAQGSDPKPTSKADCVHFSDFGFKNRGQCVSWVEHHVLGHGYGHGYGDNSKEGGDGNNDNHVATTVNLHMKGHHNFIQLFFNYFFG
jgi:hypothetical protein